MAKPVRSAPARVAVVYSRRATGILKSWSVVTKYTHYLCFARNVEALLKISVENSFDFSVERE